MPDPITQAAAIVGCIPETCSPALFESLCMKWLAANAEWWTLCHGVGQYQFGWVYNQGHVQWVLFDKSLESALARAVIAVHERQPQ